MIPLTKEDRLAAFFGQCYSVSFDPPGDGNCQFHAITHALSRYGIYRSTQSLRADIVRHLENNPNDRDGMPLELFMGMPFSDYVGQMAWDGTYGDQLTPRAASEIYNIEFTIISTLGAQGRADMTTDGFDSLDRITLVHFAEGYGDHCVFLRESGKPSAENEDVDFNSERHNGSGTKHEVIDARDTGSVVEMDATEKEHEVEMDATEAEHHVEMDATETEHKVEMDATETDHEVKIEKTEAAAAGTSPLYTLLVIILIGYRCSQQLSSSYHSIYFPWNSCFFFFLF